MSIITEYKKCLKCGKLFAWNPDVGKYRCPACGFPNKTLKKKHRAKNNFCTSPQ